MPPSREKKRDFDWTDRTEKKITIFNFAARKTFGIGNNWLNGINTGEHSQE